MFSLVEQNSAVDADEIAPADVWTVAVILIVVKVSVEALSVGLYASKSVYKCDPL